MKRVTAWALLMLLAVPVAPAHAAPTCRGRRATIHDPRARWLRGTNGDDVIVGSSANWFVDALKGDDLICQAGAHDADDIDGGRGNDRIIGTSRLTDLIGGPGNDVLTSKEPLSMDGGPGDDELRGGTGLSGGPGDDTLIARRGKEWDTYFGPGAGRDFVDSTNGAGFVAYGGAPRGVRVRLDRGTARGWGHDTLVDVEHASGTRHDDVLVGTGDVDSGGFDRNDLSGLSGDDVLIGLGGPDHLDGVAGADVARGGPGEDWLRPIYGEPPGAEGDRLYGGEGYDRLEGSSGPDLLFGGPDDDVLAGRGHHNETYGGPGNDHLKFGGHIEKLSGGPGSDTLDFTVFGPVHADLRDQTARLGNFVLELEGIESLWGSYYGDTLIGDDGPNVLFDGGNYSADGQEDVLDALGGDDRVALSGDRSDQAAGDTFDARGGEGRDTLQLQWASTIDLAAGTARVASSIGVVGGFEDVAGSREDDSLAGDDGPNHFIGYRGDDALFGRGGEDDLDGDDGTDSADGGDGTDRCAAETTTACEQSLPLNARLLVSFLRVSS
ncbi:MAG TPA: calcium-binding protein [Actinomycetota bacterium]|nr:calcium-binding protein [Actinomycetota bacterium]